MPLATALCMRQCKQAALLSTEFPTFSAFAFHALFSSLDWILPVTCRSAAAAGEERTSPGPGSGYVVLVTTTVGETARRRDVEVEAA